jgi:hypothetical protein
MSNARNRQNIYIPTISCYHVTSLLCEAAVVVAYHTEERRTYCSEIRVVFVTPSISEYRGTPFHCLNYNIVAPTWTQPLDVAEAVDGAQLDKNRFSTVEKQPQLIVF